MNDPQNFFQAPPEPGNYIPRPACEETLDRIVGLVGDHVPSILLFGPAGIGKSMLLGVLRTRLEQSHRVVHASVSASPEPELSHRIVDLLGESGDGSPHDALIGAAQRSDENGAPLVILIDHAAGAPIASSLELVRCAEAAAPSLTVVFAVSDEEGAAEFGRALTEAGALASVGFHDVMNEDEAIDYIWTRVEQGQAATEVVEKLDEDVVRWMLEDSDGLPQAINERGGRILELIAQGAELPRCAPERAAVEAPAPEIPAEPKAAPVAKPTHSPAPPPSLLADTPSAPRESLGGGLIHTEARLDPELDGPRNEPFAPGFLSEGGATPSNPLPRPPAPAQDPGPGRSLTADFEPTPAPAALGQHAVGRGAAPSPFGAPEPMASPASPTGAAALDMSAPAAPMVTPDPALEPTRSETTSESRTPYRPPLALVAMIVVGIAGAFVAGRIDFGDEAEAPAMSEREAAAAPTAIAEAGMPDTVVDGAAGFGTPPTAVEERLAASPPPMPGATLDAADPAPRALDATSNEAASSNGALAAASPTGPDRPARETRSARSDSTPSGGAARTPRSAPVEPPAPPARITATAATIAGGIAAASGAPSATPVRVARATPAPTQSSGSRASSRAVAPIERSPTNRATESMDGLDAPAVDVSGPTTAIMVAGRTETVADREPIAYVRIRIDVRPGSTVTVDGETVGVAPLGDLVLPPGPHSFVAEEPDGLVIEQLIDVSPTTRVVVF